jgi:pimeloyl-ACP methyl ester carboxylesterase
MGLLDRLRQFFTRPAATGEPASSARARGRRVEVGDGELAYFDWGDPASPDVALCVHGLTRNAHDFDRLAAALATRRRVIAYDVIGRGGSDWLKASDRYGYPLYLQHAVTLMDTLRLQAVDWIGTSMGGIIGMMVAAQHPSRVRRLILNDVGALIPKAALTRLLTYVGTTPQFADLVAAEAYFRRILAPFGKLDDATWRHITETSIRRSEEGAYTTAYDPAIAVTLAGADASDVNLWPLWTMVTQPVLLLRGAESDLLAAETAGAMAERSGVDLVEFAEVGHAPSLMVPEQIQAIETWLDR